MRNIYCQHTFPLRAFRLKKALQDSQVVAPKLHPKALCTKPTRKQLKPYFKNY